MLVAGVQDLKHLIYYRFNTGPVGKGPGVGKSFPLTPQIVPGQVLEDSACLLSLVTEQDQSCDLFSCIHGLLTLLAECH